MDEDQDTGGWGLLTEDELLKIMDAALHGSGRPLTEAELTVAAEWANLARVYALFLEGVLDGRYWLVVPADGSEIKATLAEREERSA